MVKASPIAVFFASLLLAVSGVAGAQAIKKYVTPDGKIIYSDLQSNRIHKKMC